MVTAQIVGIWDVLSKSFMIVLKYSWVLSIGRAMSETRAHTEWFHSLSILL